MRVLWFLPIVILSVFGFEHGRYLWTARQRQKALRDTWEIIEEEPLSWWESLLATILPPTRRVKLQQRIYNSLSVAGRFVNPFFHFEDKLMLDVFQYVKHQLTRINRNGIPNDQAELEKTMPLLKPRFELLREYSNQSHHTESPSRHDPDIVSDPNGTSACIPGLIETAMTVTWLGQSTCFVQINGSRTVGEWLGPKRIRPPPCSLDDLPPIDIVLVSHNHYDHLDRQVVQQLGDSVTWYVPSGLKSWFTNNGVSNVIELDWWEEIVHKDTSLKIISTPVQHWSGRHFFDVNASLWCSFVVQGEHGAFFHCGDTGYCDVFKEIGAKYGPISLAALPIGSYEPRHYLKYQHVDPEEACVIHSELKCSHSIGVHWGTFMMSDEPYLDPPKKLEEARIKLGLEPGSVFTSRLGETLLLPLGDTKMDAFASIQFEKSIGR